MKGQKLRGEEGTNFAEFITNFFFFIFAYVNDIQ